MTDLFCSFLDFRSLTTNYNVHFFLPSKRYHSSVLVHSHNSRIIKRKPLHLTLISKPSSSPAPSSSERDVISTHEHSDGSLLFRFGDPSEVAKNVEMEESKTVKEEPETEVEDDYSVVKVLDGDNEKEVMVKRSDEEVGSSLTEVADHTKAIVISSESFTVVEVESNSGEKLSSMDEIWRIVEKGLETESKISTVEYSEKETDEVISTPDVDIANTGDVAEGLNEEHEDPSPANVSILEESPEMKNGITRVELLEKEDVDVTTPVTLLPKPIIAVPDKDVFQASPETVVTTDVSAVSEPQSVEIDMHNETKEEDGEESLGTELMISPSPQSEQATSSYEVIEEQNLQDDMQNSIIGKDGENSLVARGVQNVVVDIDNGSDICDTIEAKSPPMEASMNQSETQVPDAGAGMQDEIVEDGSGSDAVQLMTVSPQLEAQSLLDEETRAEETLEESTPSEVDGTESLNVSVEIDMHDETKEEDGEESLGTELMISPSPKSEQAQSSSEVTEEQNIQDDMQKSIIGKDGENPMNALVVQGMENVVVDNDKESDTEAMSPPMEPTMNQSETQAPDAGAGMEDEIVEDGSGSDAVQLMTVSPQLQVQSLLDEETSAETLEESAASEVDGTESLKVLNDMPHDLTLGSERTEVNDNEQSDDLIQATVHEVTDLESSEFAIKSQEILVPDFVLSSGAALLPHHSKALAGGEDAYFIAGETWVGVADGVGQWSLKGTNPGVYAQELIKNCGRLISDCNGNSVNNPVELLNCSVAETHSLGSSTVLISHIDGQALHVANIGDSGFMVIRNGAVYKRSSPMRHLFHFPLQIERGDDPSSLAEVYKVDLEEGDLIITATDGLLDNLYDHEISSIVSNTLAANKRLEEIAELLAMKAQEIGHSESARSPFADNAESAGFSGYTGGKLDSMAVIVSVVQKQSSPQTL